jgi:hypothetical protein
MQSFCDFIFDVNKKKLKRKKGLLMLEGEMLTADYKVVIVHYLLGMSYKKNVCF